MFTKQHINWWFDQEGGILSAKQIKACQKTQAVLKMYSEYFWLTFLDLFVS